MPVLVLADEINRTSPPIQSALFECMGEQQVTVDGVTRKLTPPFMVIAMHNQLYATGTFPLPESLLDRFLLSIHMRARHPAPAASSTTTHTFLLCFFFHVTRE